MLTNLRNVYLQKEKITKEDILKYYYEVLPYLLSICRTNYSNW